MNSKNISQKQKQKICVAIMAILVIAIFACLITIACLSADFDFSSTDESDTSGEQQPTIPAALKNLTDIEVNHANAMTGTLVLINGDHKATINEDSLKLTKVKDYRNNNHTGDKPYMISGLETSYLEDNTMINLDKMLVALYNATGKNDTMVNNSHDSKAENELSTGMLVGLAALGSNDKTLSLTENYPDLAKWLETNAYKYGFVQRYPADKTDKTGVSNSTTYYRYVGIAHATYMKNNKLCLEEYIEMLENDKPTVEKPLTIKASDGTYAVYYYEESAGGVTEVKVPSSEEDGTQKYPYTISATNCGGLIVTVKTK